MGKGDKKSRRGKIHIGSSGVRRRRNKKSRIPAAVLIKVEETVKKPKAKTTEKPKPAVVEVAEALVTEAPVAEITAVETPAVETSPKPAAKKKAPAKSTAKKTKSQDKPTETEA